MLKKGYGVILIQIQAQKVLECLYKANLHRKSINWSSCCWFVFDDYAQSIKDLSVYENGYAFLLSEDGNFLVHEEHNEEENVKEVINGLNLLSGKEGIENYKLDGKGHILAYSKLHNGNILVITASKTDIFKSINASIAFSIIITLIVCVAVSAFAGVIGKKISGPIVL